MHYWKPKGLKGSDNFSDGVHLSEKSVMKYFRNICGAFIHNFTTDLVQVLEFCFILCSFIICAEYIHVDFSTIQTEMSIFFKKDFFPLKYEMQIVWHITSPHLLGCLTGARTY